MDDTLLNIEHIKAYLDGMARNLHRRFDASQLAGVFVHGSLINNGGRKFSQSRSDIDLLITTPLALAGERVEFLVKLKPLLVEIEVTLGKFLPVRDFLPIVSICVASQFELDEGIHMSRNARHAFDLVAFYPLGVENPALTRVGNQLQNDMLEANLLPGWTIIAAIQEARSNFVSSLLSNEQPGGTNEDASYSLISKEVLRSAYLVHCLDARIDPAMTEEDDTAKGFDKLKDMLEKAAEQEKQAAELLELFTLERPGESTLLKFGKSEQLLYLSELISVEAEKTIQLYRGFLKKGVFKLADDRVVQEQLRFKVSTLEVVDMAVILYDEHDLVQDGYLQVEIKSHEEIDLYDFDQLNKGKLTRIASEWPDDIYKYLRNTYLNDNFAVTKYISQCKIGFSGLLYTRPQDVDQPDEPKPPAIIIRPLTYWLTQHFNKDIVVKQGNWQLRKLREKYARELFTSTEDFSCGCPSSLYLEMALVTSDNKIPKLSKDPKHSVFSKKEGQGVQTCGIEFGLIWKNHLVDTDHGVKLNIRQALMDGLYDELLITPSQVERWDVHTLAVQHTHLNTSLVGVVYLSIDSKELETLITVQIDKKNKESKNKYFTTLSFLSIDDAHKKVFEDKGTGSWHHTALLRLNLVKSDD